jgi:hypothetical protein
MVRRWEWHFKSLVTRPFLDPRTTFEPLKGHAPSDWQRDRAFRPMELATKQGAKPSNPGAKGSDRGRCGETNGRNRSDACDGEAGHNDGQLIAKKVTRNQM